MKKSLFLAALATIALASCTQNELTIERQEIGFSPLQYKAVNSKTIITGNIYPSDLPFGLYAYHNDGSSNKLYINNATCSYNSDAKTFISNPIAYWPLSGTLGMVAWSPKTETITADYDLENKELILPFVAAGKEANPVDLMYSTPLTDLTKERHNSANYTGVNGGGAGVGITFKHALSQIVVTAKVAQEYAGATFKINSISLQQMNDNATLTVAESGDPVASWGWDEDTKLKNALFQILDDEEAVSYTTGDVPQVGKAVLVIPQDLENNKQKLVISYSMTFNNVTTSTTKYVDLNSGTNDALTKLDMGKKYTLNLTLYADRILYSPSIEEDWSVGGSSYDVPEQPAAGN
ncbi:MAG: fimbrillin family protein [Bacteroidaceae bacterium]|nr:fimbrillin family protein [Bacteroidaceae bacterium]